MSRGKRFRHWTQQHELLASIFDAVQVNTAATGNYKSRPKPVPWPRPKPPTTVAGILKRFGRR